MKPSSPWARFRTDLEADHEMLRRYDRQHGQGRRPDAPLMRDLVQRIGLQMMTAYRLMRWSREADVPLVPKALGRLIRFLYGSDIHYDARFEGGVVIVHGMGMAVSGDARVGPGVILSHNVTLGDGLHPETRLAGAPMVEEGVHIGPGATLLGPITIGARSKIAPGAVVRESVPPDSLVDAPSPRVTPRARRQGAARER